MKQWTPKAELYDFGRPFPTAQVQALLQGSSLLRSLEQRKPAPAVFEPGSGTGRILIPFAELYPQWRFVGQDRYGEALQVCARRAESLGLSNVHLIESDLGEDLGAKMRRWGGRQRRRLTRISSSFGNDIWSFDASIN